MKKILICVTILVFIFTIGCNSEDNTSNSSTTNDSQIDAQSNNKEEDSVDENKVEVLPIKKRIDNYMAAYCNAIAIGDKETLTSLVYGHDILEEYLSSFDEDLDYFSNFFFQNNLDKVDFKINEITKKDDDLYYVDTIIRFLKNDEVYDTIEGMYALKVIDENTIKQLHLGFDGTVYDLLDEDYYYNEHYSVSSFNLFSTFEGYLYSFDIINNSGTNLVLGGAENTMLVIELINGQIVTLPYQLSPFQTGTPWTHAGQIMIDPSEYEAGNFIKCVYMKDVQEGLDVYNIFLYGNDNYDINELSEYVINQ